ncbi:conserved Plasmodium protein, unknown function [Plasmodium ovale]|uniref:LIMP protein n=1 Tax=Plasmodium ovale TaxID=36330 RepID=A0A1D3TM19_PLAOA|nr:conserved Plasmodium protein, unknown function [Plasmodium ovale]
MIKIVLFIFLYLFSLKLSHTLGKGMDENKRTNGMFVQIDRDKNEPPYPVINIHYTESFLNEDLVKEIQNSRKMEKKKIQNYFRQNLVQNKYFMDYAKKQKEQLETLIEFIE